MIPLDQILTTKLLRRKILNEIERYIDSQESIVVTGPRQAGKTSILFLIAQRIIEEKLGSVYFYDLESPEDFELLNDLNFPKTLPPGSFLFVDEIQYHPQPDKFIKLTVDHLKGRVKLFVSGSSSLGLRKKFAEALVGRKVEFILLPLSFEEFIVFKGRKDLSRTLRDVPHSVINPYFEEFAIFGGYPRIALESDRDKKKRLLSEIFSAYIQKDIIPLFALKTPEKFTTFLRYLATFNGGMLNISNISKELAMGKSTVYSYLKSLELTYLIHLLRPFAKNLKKEITRQPKIFFLDTGFRNWLIQNFNLLSIRGDSGVLVENVVLLEMLKTFPNDVPLGYWRDKVGNEVDFIVDREYPVEVKYKRFKLPPPRGLRVYISRYKPKKAVLLTKEDRKEMVFEDTTLELIPAWNVEKKVKELLRL